MTSTIPPIVSVDDHLIEPPGVWQDRVPERYRDVAGRRLPQGLRCLCRQSGGAGTARRLVALRGPVLPGHPLYRLRRVPTQPRGQHGGLAQRHPARLLAAEGPARGHDAKRRRSIALLPQLSTVLWPDLQRGAGQGTGPALREGLQRLHGGGVVRRERGAPDTPLPDPLVGRARSGKRGPPQRGPWGAGGDLQRVARMAGSAQYLVRLLGSVLRGLRGDGHCHLHAHRLGHPHAHHVRRRAASGVDGHDLRQQRGVDGRLPAVRDPGPLPEAQAPLRRVPDRVGAVHTRTCRRRLADPFVGPRRPAGRRAPVVVLQGPDLQLLLQGCRRRVAA